MLKKIALLMMLVLPMGVFAQNLKFGHINAMEIVSAMPEYTKAQSELQALNKQLGQDLQRTQEEFNKKYQEFMQQKDSLPTVIAERRQKELDGESQYRPDGSGIQEAGRCYQSSRRSRRCYLHFRHGTYSDTLR